jgi:hypothetical protein
MSNAPTGDVAGPGSEGGSIGAVMPEVAVSGATADEGAGSGRVWSGEPAAQRLEAVVMAAAEVLGIDSVGAMLFDATGVLRLVGASDALARALETVQIELGAGPGIETAKTGRDVVITDLAAAAQWGEIADHLGAAGASAVLSSAIRADGVVVGNLNAISRRPRSWTSAEVRAVHAYARVIGALLEIAAPADPNEPVRTSGLADLTGAADSPHAEDCHADRSRPARLQPPAPRAQR